MSLENTLLYVNIVLLIYLVVLYITFKSEKAKEIQKSKLNKPGINKQDLINLLKITVYYILEILDTTDDTTKTDTEKYKIIEKLTNNIIETMIKEYNVSIEKLERKK